MIAASALEPFARALLLALALGVAGSAVLSAAVWAWIRIADTTATTRHVLWWIALAASALVPVMCLSSSLARVQHHVVPSAAVASAVQHEPAARGLRTGAAPQRAGQQLRMQAHPRRPNQPGRAGAQGGPVTPHRTALHGAAVPARWLAAAATIRQSPEFDFALIIIWLAVAGMRMGALTRRVVALRAVKHDAGNVDEAVVRKLRRWHHSSRAGRRTSLRVSAKVDVPVAVGFRAPVILLPLGIVRDEPSADVDQIALHEYAHLNRYDDWTNLAERALWCVFWFNPLVALCVRRISLEREIACDDWVIAQTGRAHRYATCLWRLVETTRLPARSVLAPGALFTSKQIVTRIERLLDSRRNALPRLSPLSALVLGSLAVALIVAGALRAPVIAIDDLHSRAEVAQGRPPLPQQHGTTTSATLATRTEVHRDARSALATRSREGIPLLSVKTLRAVAPVSRTRASLSKRERRVESLTQHAAIPVAADEQRASTLRATLRSGALAHRFSRGSLAVPAPVGGGSLGKQIATSVDDALRDANVEGVANEALDEANSALAHAHVGRAVQVALADERVADNTGGFIRDLPSFHRIVLETGVRVEVRRSSRSRVDFHAARVTAQHTTTDVQGGTLTIGGEGSWTDDEGALVTIETPSLDGIDVDGSSSVNIGAFDTDHLALAMNGSGRIEVTGGFARSAAFTISGSGDIDVLRLRTNAAAVTIEGSGDVTLTAPAALAIEIDGSGSVEVHGHAQTLSQQINGSGAIVQK